MQVLGQRVVAKEQNLKHELSELVLGLLDFFFNLIRFKGITNLISSG